MKAETRKSLSRRIDLEPIELSDEDMKYLLEKLTKHWIRKNQRQIAEDLAQAGVIHAWLKQGKYEGKNGARLRTFCFKVGLNAGRSILRTLLRRERFFEENKETIAQNLGQVFGCEDSDSGEEPVY